MDADPAGLAGLPCTGHGVSRGCPEIVVPDNPVITLADEAELLASHAQITDPLLQLRGIDAFGADATLDGEPVRIRFGTNPVTKEAWWPALQGELATTTYRSNN